ncbi:MAG: peptide ABC transporter substrate-binding protein [Planctomycetota bacterium]
MNLFTRFLLCFLLVIPGLASAQAHDDAKSTLIIGSTFKDHKFDPALVYFTWDYRLSPALFETLLVLGEDGLSLEPGVAESWEVSDDGLLYTFHLRDDARWSDGSAVVADHFVSGWFRALMPDTQVHVNTLHDLIDGAFGIYEKRQAFIQQWVDRDENAPLRAVRQNWKQLREAYTKSVWAEGEHTLKVKLARPAPHFPYLVIHPVFAPLPGRMMENDFDIKMDFAGRTKLMSGVFSDPEKALFNGPYRLEKRPERQGDIYLVANEQYWDRERVGCRRIHIRVFDDQVAMLDGHNRGETDWVPSLLYSEELEQMILADRPDVHVTPQVGTYYYEFNCRAEINGKVNPFADPKLRRALAHLFDRKAMAKVMGLLHAPQLSFIPPETMPRYEPAESSLARFDVERAKRLLTEAGYDNLKELGQITILVNEESSHADAARTLIKNLKAVGLEVRLEAPRFSEYLKRSEEGGFHLRRAGWYADFHDPVAFLDLQAPWSDTESGFEDSRFKKKYYDGVVASDVEQRLQLLREAEAMLLEQAVVVPISQYHGVSLHDQSKVRVSCHAWGYSRLDRIRKVAKNARD